MIPKAFLFSKAFCNLQTKHPSIPHHPSDDLISDLHTLGQIPVITLYLPTSLLIYKLHMNRFHKERLHQSMSADYFYTELWAILIFFFMLFCVFSAFYQGHMWFLQPMNSILIQWSLLCTHHVPGTVPWSEDTTTNKLNEHLCPCELTSPWRRHTVQKKKSKNSMFAGDIKLRRIVGVKW